MTTDAVSATVKAALEPYERMVTLSRAIQDKAGNPITVLRLQEPTVADLIIADKVVGNVARVAAIIARQTAIPMQIIETMRAADFAKCDKAIGELMGNDQPEDGETSPS